MTAPISVAAAQALDAHTINDIGIPSMVLMERAALAIFNNLLNDDFDLGHVVVVAGTGNNGGDGVAVARLLAIRGLNVSVLLLGDPAHASDQTRQQLQIASHYHVPVSHEVDLITQATTLVDAIFGVGLDRDVTGRFAEVIHAINASPAAVVAVDVPSGLNADTGAVMGVAVTANMTTTMAYRKLGFLTDTGRAHLGRLYVADIGVYRDDRLETH